MLFSLDDELLNIKHLTFIIKRIKVSPTPLPSWLIIGYSIAALSEVVFLPKKPLRGIRKGHIRELCAEYADTRPLRIRLRANGGLLCSRIMPTVAAMA